jgi:hypothetical protein
MTDNPGPAHVGFLDPTPPRRIYRSLVDEDGDRLGRAQALHSKPEIPVQGLDCSSVTVESRPRIRITLGDSAPRLQKTMYGASADSRQMQCIPPFSAAASRGR